eukprot:2603487-Lingulodinium_polyedra.AAC.1
MAARTGNDGRELAARAGAVGRAGGSVTARVRRQLCASRRKAARRGRLHGHQGCILDWVVEKSSAR